MATLEEIEGDRWPDPPPDSTSLVRRCTLLRRVDVDLLDAEALRVLLGQAIGVPVLLPRAVRMLLADPWVTGHLYPGDLLCAVLRLPRTAWADDERAEVRERLARFATAPAPVDADDLDPTGHVRARVAQFLAEP